MTERRPGRWPVDEPADLDAIEHQAVDDQDELYLQRAQEKALHEMVLDSIRHDLDQQPSPGSVFVAARAWCARITAAADEISTAKRKAA
ncbi:hypothetical protein [Streptomyces formicae]